MAAQYYTRNGRAKKRSCPSHEIENPVHGSVVLYTEDLGDGRGQQRIVSTRVGTVENGESKEASPWRVVP